MPDKAELTVIEQNLPQGESLLLAITTAISSIGHGHRADRARQKEWRLVEVEPD
ncbi:hypothetical protein ACT691_14760 [Vibrio metschnikovii]